MQPAFAAGRSQGATTTQIGSLTEFTGSDNFLSSFNNSATMATPYRKTEDSHILDCFHFRSHDNLLHIRERINPTFTTLDGAERVCETAAGVGGLHPHFWVKTLSNETGLPIILLLFELFTERILCLVSFALVTIASKIQ
jgi:hypothetical protein